MKQYGFSYQDIESWGGKVLFPGPAVVGVPLVRNGQANAIFQEGQHHPMWEQLAEGTTAALFGGEPESGRLHERNLRFQ